MEIILKIDNNKNAHILNGIASINEAAVEIGKGLIQSVGGKV